MKGTHINDLVAFIDFEGLFGDDGTLVVTVSVPIRFIGVYYVFAELDTASFFIHH